MQRKKGSFLKHAVNGKDTCVSLWKGMGHVE